MLPMGQALPDVRQKSAGSGASTVATAAALASVATDAELVLEWQVASRGDAAEEAGAAESQFGAAGDEPIIGCLPPPAENAPTKERTTLQQVRSSRKRRWWTMAMIQSRTKATLLL